ncbi:hypothetical protein GCM10017581_038830 [Dactylosporangium matsuzakiense]|uniref:Condensation domain-containing protein n=1 Tax=Dactylosporangium matsuzakiense TaxID=53360 RepID=A0A9W6NMF4_9ACTN|nr:hypothetical protein GCM10017581_038830 [Dactylosporangium matsuzakiense]
MPLPEGMSVRELSEVLGRLLAGFEALRTVLEPVDDPEQLVLAGGELDVRICDRMSAAPAMAVLRRPFTPAELPIRALVLRDGPLRTLLLECSHLAADLAGMRVIERAIRQSWEPAGTRPARAEARQPVDQALVEHEDAQRRRASAALDYWVRTLGRVPQAMFALPRPQAGEARLWHAELRSRALALGADAVARRCRVSRSAALLTAMAALVGLYTGNDTCVVASLSGNRSEPRLQDYVGTLVQDALMELPVRGETFDELVRRCWPAILDAYRHGRFDAAELWRRVGGVGERRGTHFFRDFAFNDQRDDAGSDGAATAGESALRWLDTQSQGETFVFDVHRLDEDVAEVSLRADGRLLPRELVEALLTGMERLIVDAATRDVPMPEVPAVTGIRPLRRGPEWLMIDSCWVDVTEVRQLLLDLPGVLDAEIATVPSGAPELHARVVVASAGPTPASLREACLARLPDRPAAMVPSRYTVVPGPR